MKTVLLEISPMAMLKATLSFLPLAVVSNLAIAEEGHDHRLGVQLFQLCSACHGPQGHGNRELFAPSIAGLPEWYVQNQLRNFKDGKRGAHPLDLSGLRMRPMARSLIKEGDLLAIAHYVAELPPKTPVDVLKGGHVERGKLIYENPATGCANCHGEIAKLQPSPKAPPQDNLEDWYMLEQLRKFKNGVRGGAYPKDGNGAPKDIDGLQMQATIKAIPDEQAMKDVIAYIRQEAKKGTLGKMPAQTATKTNTPTNNK